jgi:hypothetical protein
MFHVEHPTAAVAPKLRRVLMFHVEHFAGQAEWESWECSTWNIGATRSAGLWRMFHVEHSRGQDRGASVRCARFALFSRVFPWLRATFSMFFPHLAMIAGPPDASPGSAADTHRNR